VIGDACPTFSWGSVNGAKSYELVVYRIGAEGEEAEPVLRQAIAGSALGWTPSLDLCLERSGQYAWSVRAVGQRELSGWSPPNLFQVAAGPSQAEFEEALAVVQRYLGQREGNLRKAHVPEATEAEDTEVLEPTLSASGASTVSGVVGATQLTVDGGVVATSFTGDGSTLSALNPANLSVGLAGINNSGTAASASNVVCTGCVAASDIAANSVGESEIIDNSITADDIGANAVESSELAGTLTLKHQFNFLKLRTFLGQATHVRTSGGADTHIIDNLSDCDSTSERGRLLIASTDEGDVFCYCGCETSNQCASNDVSYICFSD